MNPFYFGKSERPLFGVYSHGRPDAGAAKSVLLCYPVGSEYMRAHRAFRQLNALLNRTGMNVLRFDYSCTGDSGGDGQEASVTEWIDDVDWAIDELRDNAVAGTVSIVGLRMGAWLAAQACAQRDDVSHLILWDPMVSGTHYLDQMIGTPRPDGVFGIEGFPFTPTMRDEIDQIDLRSALEALDGVPVSLIASEDRLQYCDLADIDPSRIHLQVVPSEGNWEQADPFGDALIPQQIIQAIVDRLKTGFLV